MTNYPSLPRTVGFLWDEALAVLKPGQSQIDQDGWSLYYYIFKTLTFWPRKRGINLLAYVFFLLTALSLVEENHSSIFQEHFLKMIQANILSI